MFCRFSARTAKRVFCQKNVDIATWVKTIENGIMFWTFSFAKLLACMVRNKYVMFYIELELFLKICLIFNFLFIIISKWFKVLLDLEYSWFHKKGSFSVLSFNDDYLSIPERPGTADFIYKVLGVYTRSMETIYLFEGTGRCGYLCHEIPGS